VLCAKQHRFDADHSVPPAAAKLSRKAPIWLRYLPSRRQPGASIKTKAVPARRSYCAVRRDMPPCLCLTQAARGPHASRLCLAGFRLSEFAAGKTGNSGRKPRPSSIPERTSRQFQREP